VTGNDKAQIEISAFQVSDQCMALVKDGIITASKDPKFMKVKRSTTRYIPDVMFSAKNEYGIEVVQKAEPNFPLDFFITRVRQYTTISYISSYVKVLQRSQIPCSNLANSL
jgi:nuclear protein localization family protein 4